MISVTCQYFTVQWFALHTLERLGSGSFEGTWLVPGPRRFLSHVQIKLCDPGDENERGGERTVGTRLRFTQDNKHNSLKTELVTFIYF